MHPPPPPRTAGPTLGELARAVERLRAGGLVAFPTETVYGLGADALSAQAVRRVFALKGRPSTNPLIVHVTGGEMARRVVRWNERAEKLARALWPGPVTLVLPSLGVVPAEVTGGGDSVAVRAPDHPAALALLFEFGAPLVGPSANLSGAVSPTRPEHVRSAFSEHDVLVLDGGACSAGIESSVVLLTEPRVRILRPGVIGPAQIARVLGEACDGPSGSVEPGGPGPLASPGLLSQHYAPRTGAVLIDERELPRVLREHARVAVIAHRALDVPDPHVLLPLPDDPAGYARGLYDALRQADDAGAALIAIVRPPAPDASDDGAIWLAVHDRLARATAR